MDSGRSSSPAKAREARNARPAVMALSRSLGDFVVASAGPHTGVGHCGHGAGAGPCLGSGCAGLYRYWRRYLELCPV
ncbi:ethanolamine ammonia-lyase reactivating factor EutA [Klebsiella pneumoniae]|nr:ethanolamine ammonia-lyase reactivating factor EutA [Klebsiella pneumoniae]